MPDYELLGKIQSPDDVKKLDETQLPLLCEEIRDKLITTISKNGGHLASNLGVVELTVALHRIFDSPKDAIIFDVGHQCYTHKLLTGRADAFDTLRTENGISGFMRPDESIHDPIVTGHSSNAVSAAYGIIKAKSILGQEGRAIAVVGDGAMTGGMFFEALNNAGRSKENLIVILNDNKMSISRNVGAFARYLGVIRSRPSYYRFKRFIERSVSGIPIIGSHLKRNLTLSKNLLKNAIYHSNLFEDMGFHYLGPVDGHNLEKLETVLKLAKTMSRPVLIHVITVKGKGYEHAEKSPGSFHGVPAFDIETGCYTGAEDNFSSVFGELLCRHAAADPRICAITAAMTCATGLGKFEVCFRNRFFDVGIAEQHAVTFAAGLAAAGARPVFAVYSSFLQRGYDQIIHDTAIQRLPVVFGVDRAGIVGEDGETHQGIFDVSFLSAIPGVTLYSPSCYADLKIAMEEAFLNGGVTAIRYPRGSEPVLPDSYIPDASPYSLHGDPQAKIALITYGRIFAEALEAQRILSQKGLLVCVVKLNRIHPLPDDLFLRLAGFDRICFFEEGILAGGVGEHTGNRLLDAGYRGSYHITAINNQFAGQSSVEAALKKYRLDGPSMAEVICEGEHLV